MLEVLIGMIASNKSTYARARADQGALVIAHDELVSMLHARYRFEPALRNVYRAMMLEVARIGIIAGRDVVIDRTHLTRESRALWVNAGHAWGVKVRATWFPIELPAIHAQRRYDHDPRGRSLDDWLQVAINHYVEAEQNPFSGDEGFDMAGPPIAIPSTMTHRSKFDNFNPRSG